MKISKMDLVENILNFKDRCLELIFPPRCMFCSKVVSVGECVCDICLESVEHVIQNRTILEWGDSSINCITPFKYSGKVREAICRFKFEGQKHYANYFAKVLSRDLADSCKNVDFITSVPLSKDSLVKRGYNQSEFLAKLISKNLHIPYENFLVKIKENFPQHTLSFKERTENVKGVYKVLNVNKIRNKNILLCDDVVTTGSTLGECSKMMKLFGARYVMCCAIAYA